MINPEHAAVGVDARGRSGLQHCAADGHDGGHDAVDSLGALLLARFDVAGGVGLDRDVGGQPTQDRMVAVPDLAGDDRSLELGRQVRQC